MKRNYPTEVVSSQIDRAKTKERKQHIFQNRKVKSKSDGKVRLIFTHGAANPPIHMWIREGQKLLARNDQAKAMGDMIQICSNQPKNLLSIEKGPGGGHKPDPNAGCYKCDHCKASCPILNETKHFKAQTLARFTRSGNTFL